MYISLTMLLVGMILVTSYLYMERRERMDDLRLHVMWVAGSVAATSADDILNKDDYALYKSIESAVDIEKDLAKKRGRDLDEFIEVLDRDGRSIAQVKEGFGQGADAIVGHTRKSALEAAKPVVWKTGANDGSNLVESAYPMFLGGERIGTVRVGISDKEYRAETLDFLLDALGMVLAAGLLGFIFGGRIAEWVSRPIADLVKGAGEFSKGNLDYRVEVSSPGEMAALASGFNDMAERLRDKIGSLGQAREEAEGLSEKLAESYKEVSHAAEKLQASNEWVTDLAFRLEEANQGLKAEKVQTETIVHSIRDGLVALDKEGLIMLMNPEAEEVFDVREEDVKGQPVKVLVDRLVQKIEEPEAFLNKFMAAASTPDTENAFTITILRPYHRVLRRLSSAIRDENGEVVGRVVTFRDITREKEVDDMKTNFVSTVSHELRTPLTSIKGALNLLLDGHIDDQETRREFLKIAEQNTDRLISLITSLLDLSRMESGRVGMRFARVDMNQAVGSVVKSTSVLARQNGVKVDCAGGEAPALVIGDRDRIEQVLVNLIGNAIKFSEPGAVIRVITDIGEEEVRLTVEDEGVGIPKDKLEKIFDRFYQVDMSATRRIGGTGLGLTICKAIVKEHGGRMWAESPATPDGRGARFVVSLPKGDLPMREPSDLVKQVLLKEGPLQEGGGGKTVLVVDDDPNILTIHKRAFEQEGYHVLTASTGKDALKLAREKRPGFIFLDVLLPDLDGFDVASILRSDPATKDTPIVFTTVLGEEGREKGMNLGSGYITKPFNEDQLLSAVRKIIK